MGQIVQEPSRFQQTTAPSVNITSRDPTTSQLQYRTPAAVLAQVVAILSIIGRSFFWGTTERDFATLKKRREYRPDQPLEDLIRAYR